MVLQAITGTGTGSPTLLHHIKPNSHSLTTNEWTQQHNAVRNNFHNLASQL